MDMAVDVTGFQRMRREQASKTTAWEDMTYNDLKAAAKGKGIQGYHKMKKTELIEALKG